MAKIPDFTSQELSVPRGRRPVGNVTQIRPAGLDQGESAVSNALLQAGADLTKLKQARDRREDMIASAEAESSFLKSRLDIEREILSTDDYGNYVSQYQERVAKARDQAIANIRDPGTRRIMSARLAEVAARGAFEMHGRSLAKERDVGQARLDVALTSNLDLLADPNITEGKRIELLQASKHMITAARTAQLITAEEAVNQEQAFLSGYAETRLLQLPPKERVAALKSRTGFTKYIDPGRREQFRKSAENESKDEDERVQAQTVADEAMRRFSGHQQRINYVRSQLSGQARDRAEAYVDRQAERDRTAAREGEDGMIDAAVKWVQANPHTPLTDFPGYLQLKPSDRVRMENWAAGKRMPDQLAYYDKMVQLASDPNTKPLLAQTDLAEIYQMVPPTQLSQVIKWRQEAIEGVPVAATDGQISKLVTDITRQVWGAKPNAKKAGAFRMEFYNRVEDKTRELKRKPTFSELREIANDMAVVVSGDTNWLPLFGGFEAPAFMVTREQWADAKITPDVRRLVLQAARDRAGSPNLQLTDDQMRALLQEGILE